MDNTLTVVTNMLLYPLAKASFPIGMALGLDDKTGFCVVYLYIPVSSNLSLMFLIGLYPIPW